MNKNEKNYVDAINEIKANDEMKKELYKSIKSESSGKKHRITYIYAISAAMIVIIFTIMISIGLNVNKNKIRSIEFDSMAKQEDEKKLPTIDSFENLYKMLAINENDSLRKSNSLTDALTGAMGVEESAKQEGGASTRGC